MPSFVSDWINVVIVISMRLVASTRITLRASGLVGYCTDSVPFAASLADSPAVYRHCRAIEATSILGARITTP